MLKSFAKVILFVLALVVLTNDTVASILQHWSITAIAGILIAVSFVALILYVRKVGTSASAEGHHSILDEIPDERLDEIYDPEADTVPILEFDSSPPPRFEDEGEHHE